MENAQSSDATMDEMVSKLSTHVEDAQSSDATMEDMVSKLSINGDIHVCICRKDSHIGSYPSYWLLVPVTSG